MLAADYLHRLSRRGGVDKFDIGRTDKAVDLVAECLRPGYEQNFLAARLHGLLDAFEDLFERLVAGHAGSLSYAAHGAQHEPAAVVFVSRDYVHRNMSGNRVVFQVVEDGPAAHIG